MLYVKVEIRLSTRREIIDISSNIIITIIVTQSKGVLGIKVSNEPSQQCL